MTTCDEAPDKAVTDCWTDCVCKRQDGHSGWHVAPCGARWVGPVTVVAHDGLPPIERHATLYRMLTDKEVAL